MYLIAVAAVSIVALAYLLLSGRAGGDKGCQVGERGDDGQTIGSENGGLEFDLNEDVGLTPTVGFTKYDVRQLRLVLRASVSTRFGERLQVHVGLPSKAAFAKASVTLGKLVVASVVLCKRVDCYVTQWVDRAARPRGERGDTTEAGEGEAEAALCGEEQALAVNPVEVVGGDDIPQGTSQRGRCGYQTARLAVGVYGGVGAMQVPVVGGLKDIGVQGAPLFGVVEEGEFGLEPRSLRLPPSIEHI